MAAASVEVRGVPGDVADELLVLYFENRRRSGGGAVQSCRRRGARATLTFESAEDAQRVLSRTDHRLQDAHLTVHPAAPRDYGKVVLQGLNPQTSQDLVELYVERMLNCESGVCPVFRSHRGDQALVQLTNPLSNAEFLALGEHVQSRPLDGAHLALDWVEQTDGVLVQRGEGPGPSPLSQDLLELYFESKRSGGGPVRAVRLLQGATVAVVSFQNPAVVEKVLQKTHRLPDGILAVSPHYDFLEPPEQEGAPLGDTGTPFALLPLPEAFPRQLLQVDLVLRELNAPAPECVIALGEAGLRVSGGDPLRQKWLLEHVQGVLQNVIPERLPFSAWVLDFLRQEDVRSRLAELLAERGLGACFLPAADEVVVAALRPETARLATELLGSSLGHFALPLSERHLPALASPRWAQLQGALPCCLVRLDQGGEQLEGLTLAGMEPENRARLAAFLQESMPDEALVAMEPGALRYLQRYYQDVLAGMGSVTLLPLEGDDVTGLRLSGEAGACQAAAELLQSLLSAIHTQTVTLELPGVCRFLQEKRGRETVQELERRFRCTIDLERVRWSPPETQHELEASQEPLAVSCPRDSPRGQERLGAPVGAAGERSDTNLEEIKGLLAALQAPRRGSWSLENVKVEEEEQEDLYTAPEPPSQAAEAAPAAARAEGSEAAAEEEEGALEEGPLALRSSAAEEEEEAQLLLAIQQSMDSARQEEEELRRAMELSLTSWVQEQAPSADATLLSALSISLEDARQAADSAQVAVFLGAEEDVAPLAQELKDALRAQLREETVPHAALRSLAPPCLAYLAHLERKHAVRISLDGEVAVVRGFADYPVAATRDLALLLTRLLRTETAGDPGNACWVHWDPQGSSTPYSAQASALLEQAWGRGLKHLDIFFDGRPFAIDFERMEEYDLGSARTVPIGRLPGPSGPVGLDDGEARLVQLVEGTEEFRETVRHFYDTLEEMHNKIRIVKVEKLLHPLLYQQYQLKKVALLNVCGRRDVERILFHGTTEESSREICLHGFNRSFCGKNATRYGHGVYFAVKAVVSVQEMYSPASSDGNKYIFVTQTLTGDYALGKPGMRAPPLREGDAVPRRYDSTVDNLQNPAIFVIFNDTQAYPQHLITCRWSKQP
ncbi:protein mono-ADP-ribosyltransferase PARP10 [Zootoca vivipara]|uniref:protein mono-ADP-ribosyltransferase PARP10 n=1 Tax=Zootoca vivipara TaxID=8524 RepID=UPI0015900551|nr:protein mono-ADP-ribosyltransferase PARP10 [Zootoca vivipara]